MSHEMKAELQVLNERLQQQNRYLAQISDSLEDRVIQEALKHDLELTTGSKGRRRQA